jgi:beta-xylosidase
VAESSEMLRHARAALAIVRVHAALIVRMLSGRDAHEGNALLSQTVEPRHMIGKRRRENDAVRSRLLPLPKPKATRPTPAEQILSDDFSKDRLGTVWRFHKPKVDELARVQRSNGSMLLKAKGTSPADCSPLTMIPGDRAYEVQVTLEPTGGAEGGLLFFYNERAYVGCGFDGSKLSTYVYGERHDWLSHSCLL